VPREQIPSKLRPAPEASHMDDPLPDDAELLRIGREIRDASTLPSSTGTKPVAWRTRRDGSWIYYEEYPRYLDGPSEPLYLAASAIGPSPTALDLIREVKERCHDDLPLDLWRKVEDFLASADGGGADG
jgi:hypothetical protein